MSGATRCWHCTGRLVGPGGVKGKEPLFYREVEIEPGRKVRTHVACADALKTSLARITARPDSDKCPICGRATPCRCNEETL